MEGRRPSGKNPKRGKIKEIGDGVIRRVPSLPKHRNWHKMTRLWWRHVWRSPMAAEYIEADIHGLYRLVELIDRYWEDPTPKLNAEIRLEQTNYGLTPLDRLRLRWEIRKVESVERKSPHRQVQTGDPRDILRMVQ